MNRQSPNRDPNDGRLMLGCGGLLFLPFIAVGMHALLFKMPRPQGPLEWGIRCLLGELGVAAAGFFGIGFLWAVSGNRRLKAWLDKAAGRFAWILIPLAIPGFVLAAYGAFFR